MKRAFPAAGLLLLIAIALAPTGKGVAPAAAGEEEVFVTPDEAPRLLFPDATSVEKRTVSVTPDLKARIEKAIAPTQPSLWEGSIPTFVASKDGRVIGYAVIVNEIGKHRPITFVVGVTPDEKVKGIEIMVYREPKGGEVRMKGFLKQYRGKDLEEPILTGRDITNITGATLSVRAVNRGTKKALALVHLIYLTPQAAAGPQP